MRIELGSNKTLFIHLTLVPYISTAGEIKTKPSQHSVKELRTIGIQPDILICRSEKPLPADAQEKIALFTNVEKRGVISLIDMPSIYQIPQALHQQGLDALVIEKLQLATKPADLSDWQHVAYDEQHPQHIVNIAMVGKYVDLTDCYKSLTEALKHAGIKNKTKINIHYIDAETLEQNGTLLLNHCDAILVPGGFGTRGAKGKILATQYARENNVPFLGICLGMQIAVIEFARHVANMHNADSTEFNKDTPYPIVSLVTEWTTSEGKIETRHNHHDLGGTMRLGNQICELQTGSLAHQIYGKNSITERHRHRYEINNQLLNKLENAGLTISGRSKTEHLVEMVEIPNHPWFIGCQFHPEFTSTPRKGHPLFNGFIQAALKQHQKNKSEKNFIPSV